jgi:hypothetical protein
MALQELPVAHNELVNLGPTYLHSHITIIPFISGSIILTNMPSASTELPNSYYRILLDLTGYTYIACTLNVEVVGYSSSIISFQYYESDVFLDMDAKSWTPFPSLEVPINGLGFKMVGWKSIPTGAKNPNLGIRMVGRGGNGIIDPKLNQIYLYLK